MFVYENGVKIRTIPVSTGKPDEEETMTPAWEGDVGRYVGTFFSFGTWADEGRSEHAIKKAARRNSWVCFRIAFLLGVWGCLPE